MIKATPTQAGRLFAEHGCPKRTTSTTLSLSITAAMAASLLDADLGENRRQRGEHRRQDSSEVPRGERRTRSCQLVRLFTRGAGCLSQFSQVVPWDDTIW